MIRIFCLYVTKLFLYYLHNHNYFLLQISTLGKQIYITLITFFLDPICINIAFVDFCSCNRVYKNKICLS